MKAGWKRLVSLCLIVALSLGVFAVGASAADPEELRIPFKMELEEAVAGVEFQLEF